jgi:hypothetical protein
MRLGGRQPNWVQAKQPSIILSSAAGYVADNAKTTCMFTVDLGQLGDPANGCGKDFFANWRCGNDQNVHKFYLPVEASGKPAVLSCPAP